jgi:ATP-dependent protease HslVU (ClpYQ) peptidase subunit
MKYDRNNIYTVNDFMKALAQALDERDMELVETCRAVADDWLQDQEEHHSQVMLIDAVENAIMDIAEEI